MLGTRSLRYRICAAGVMLALVAGDLAFLVSSPSRAAEPESDHILVKLDPAASPGEKAAALQDVDAVTVEPLMAGWVDVTTDDPLTERQAEARLDDVTAPRDVELDREMWHVATTPNDPGYASEWGLEQGNDVDVDAASAWDVAQGSASVTVAVVDTGVDVSHPDLAGRIWTNPGEVPGNGIDDDANLLVDDVNGWDFHYNDASVYDGSSDSHGTHVSGTIGAASNNGVGVTGVDWNARIMPVKFLGPSGGSTSNAIKAINYAVAKGAKVINASWGGGGYSSALLAAINAAGAAGVVFVAAAGNSGIDVDVTPFYPAAYNSTNLVSVAAVAGNGTRASFSNYGATNVDLGAPGVSIYSTLPGNTYGYYSGTSMAAPHVSGASALVAGAVPGATPAAIKATLMGNVDPQADLAGATVSGGRLNADGAVRAAVGPPAPPPAPPETSLI